jgi:mono/diheme cytochrome c family protein
MPAVGDTWSRPEVDAVISYLKQTKGGAQLGG